MKKLSILIILSVIILVSKAQNITIDEVTNNSFRNENIYGINPLEDGENYSLLSEDNKKIVKYSFKTGKEIETIFDVSTARNCPVNTIDGYIFSPDEKRILIQTNTKPIYRHSFTAEYYIFDIKNNKMEPLSDEGPQQVPLFSPDGTQIAFVRDNNIYLVKLLFGNSESQVTTDGKKNEILNGIPDWVYEEEFAFNRAFDFSPDGQMIAYIKFDEKDVPTYSFPMYKGMNPSLQEYETYPGEYKYKYPMSGVKNSKVSVHTFDIKSKVTRKMDLPIDSDSYIPRIKFTHSPDELAVMVLNRHQNQFDLYYSNPRSRVSKIMVRDKSPQYIKESAYSDIVFYPENFIMMSEKDGFNHLYLYNAGGNLVKQITKGNFEVKKFLGWDKATNTFYYESNEGNPTQSAIYKIDAKGKKTLLSSKKGTNNAIFSKNMKNYINTYSNANTPPVITINDNNGKVITTMLDNGKLKDKLAKIDMPTKELFTFKTSKGVELYGYIIKPSNFDANKKYPVIMYQYSGPGSQEVVDKWNIGARRDGCMFETYLAQNGYISVCVDGRGTGGRGSDFEKSTYKKLGLQECEDQVEAAKYIASLPYVDGKRIGIWGWSYGGYNTLMSMSEGTPIFKAGVAVAAPTDWRFYDTVYTERFMQTPKENMENYEATSAIKRASKLNGELLLIHGTADDNVHLRNVAEYSEALVQADKQFEMQIYTNRNHGIRGGNTSKHLFTRIVNFFNKNLK